MKHILILFLSFIFLIRTNAQINVQGTVTASDTEEFLIGVTVMLKGTNRGTATDISGKYEILVPPDGVLVFSYIGYNTEEISVNAQESINVILIPKLEDLGEIVVIGYGTQKKIDLTSSIATLDPQELIKMPGGVREGLQGQVSGIQMTDNRVRIRGVGTVNSTDPLWVVDGLIMEGSDQMKEGSNLNLPNENEIESIQVLKDAASCAIYGARASNGVIIITTKKGKQGKTKVEYHMYAGTKKAWKQIDLLNGTEMAELANEAVYNYTQQYPQRPVRYVDSYRNPDSIGEGTDWQGAWFRNGSYWKHNLTITGGSEYASFRVSANYSTDNKIVIRNDRKDYGIRVNSDIKKGRFTAGESFNISRSDRLLNEGLIDEVWRMTPNIDIYDENALGGYDGSKLEDGHDMYNPIGLANLTDFNKYDFSIDGNAWIGINLFSGLDYKVNVGYAQWFYSEYYYEGRYMFGGLDGQRLHDYIVIREVTKKNNRVLMEHTLTYDKEFGKHHITFLGGVTSETYKYRELRGNEKDLPTDQITIIGTGTEDVVDGSANEWAMFSLLGRINYGYAGKYMLTGNIRRDGSSKFGKKYRYGVFPSVSAGWRISEEAFIKDNIQFISNLKLRASYGAVGNDRVPSYGYESYLNLYQLYYLNGQRVPAYINVTFGTPGLKWESSYSADIGIDIGLFNEKVNFVFDYYNKRTEDMLLQSPIPLSSGIDGVADPPYLNSGSMSNKGLEFALNYRNNYGELYYSVGANLSTVKNEVLELGIDAEPIMSGRVEPNAYLVTRTAEGSSVGRFYGFVTDGIYQSQEEIDAMNRPQLDEAGNVVTDANGDIVYNIFAPNATPGDIRFKDLNNDGLLDEENDRTYIGSPIPDFSYGFTIDMSYRGFDFSMLIHGDYGNEIYNQGKYFTENMQHYSNNAAVTLDRWRGEDLTFVHPESGVTTVYEANTDTDMPRAVLNDPNGNIQKASDRFIEDGSYMRIKRLTIGYTLPKKIINKLYIQNLRIYIGSKNLLTLTEYSGYDPEVGDRGVTEKHNLNRGIDVHSWGGLTYMVPREFFAGLQVEF